MLLSKLASALVTFVTVKRSASPGNARSKRARYLGSELQHRQKAVAFPQAKLDGMISEHRNQGLVLQFLHPWVAPS